MTPAQERVPLARRGLLHGNTHAPDHDELLDLLESMQQTQFGVFAIAALALVVAAVALTLAVAR